MVVIRIADRASSKTASRNILLQDVLQLPDCCHAAAEIHIMLCIKCRIKAHHLIWYSWYDIDHFP